MTGDVEFYRELLNAVRSMADAQQAMAEALSRLSGPAQNERKITAEDERTALAVVAIAKGADSYAAVARELGIHKSTAARNPGIRRAMESAIKDRRVDSREADDFRFNDER